MLNEPNSLTSLTVKSPSNTTVTMTSLELVDYINSERKEGEPELRHDNFMSKVAKVLGESVAPKFLGTTHYTNGAGAKVLRNIYIFPKREACLMAMSYSYELQAKVFDRMTALEQALSAQRAPIETLTAEKLGIARLFEVPLHMAQVETVKQIRAETGVDLSPWLALAPAQSNLRPQDVYLEPTELGKRFGLSAVAMNRKLGEAGLQERVNGAWVATDDAKGICTLHQWSNGSKSGVNYKWNVAAVERALGESAAPSR